MNQLNATQLVTANTTNPEAPLDILGLLKPPKYSYRMEQCISTVHHFDLNDYIGAPSEYVDMLNIIRNATDLDAIVFHINSLGGRLDTTVQLINAMQSSPAKVYGIMEGDCASAASAILLNCDEIQIMPHTMMMIHNYSGGAVGTGNNMYNEILAYRNAYYDTFKEWYVPFLTEAEFDQMINSSTDVYINAKQVVERLERRNQYYEQEAKRIEREAKKAAREALQDATNIEPVEVVARPKRSRTTKTETVETTPEE